MKRFRLLPYALIVVMAIVSVLAPAAALYQKSVIRTKESLLKNNLFALRAVIDEYSRDKKRAPQHLQDLVTAGYLGEVPKDPIAGADQWTAIMEDALTAVDRAEPGIRDVRSRADQKSLEGTPYSEW